MRFLKLVGQGLKIGSALVEGMEVDLHGFGKFGVVHREARTGRNPSIGEEIMSRCTTALIT